jgi:hypothetical protein
MDATIAMLPDAEFQFAGDDIVHLLFRVLVTGRRHALLFD